MRAEYLCNGAKQKHVEEYIRFVIESVEKT